MTVVHDNMGGSEEKLRRMRSVQDRKFAFLSNVTRPDYRSVTTPSSLDGGVCLTTSTVAPIASPELSSPEGNFPSSFSSCELSSYLTETKVENKEVKNNLIVVEDVSEKKENPIEVEQVTEEVVVNDEAEAVTSIEIQETEPSADEVVVECLQIQQSSSEETTKITPTPCELKKIEEKYGSPQKASIAMILDDDTFDASDEDSEDEATSMSSSDDESKRPTDPSTLPQSSTLEPALGAGLQDEIPRTLPETSIEPRIEELLKDMSLRTYHESTTEEPPSEDVLQTSVHQLEKQLRKADVQSSRLQRILELQQKDIESLRYEMTWKDERIDYLQKCLQEMEEKLGKR